MISTRPQPVLKCTSAVGTTNIEKYLLETERQWKKSSKTSLIGRYGRTEEEGKGLLERREKIISV
jgi:hypothetical protein